MTVPAPTALDEVPKRILEAYDFIGLDIKQVKVLLPLLWQECRNSNGLQLRSTFAAMDHTDFNEWFKNAIITGPDERFQTWLDPLNTLLSTIQPEVDQYERINSKNVLYSVLLYLLAPLFSLSDLIRLKGGWHLLCEPLPYYDINIQHMLPRTQHEREQLLTLFDEIKEPCVRRLIIRFIGLSPINPLLGSAQRNVINYGIDDAWGKKVQSDMFARHSVLYKNIDAEELGREYMTKTMIARIVDVNQLSEMALCDDPMLSQCAIDRWDTAIRHDEISRDWSVVHDLAIKKPELFAKIHCADLNIIEILWQSEAEKHKKNAIDNIFDYTYMASNPYDKGKKAHEFPEVNKQVEAGLILLTKMLNDDKNAFMSVVRLYQIPGPQLPYIVFSQGAEQLYDLMWQHVVEGHSESTRYKPLPEMANATINLMLSLIPEKISELSPRDLGSLLARCTAETLTTIHEIIMPLVTKHDTAARGLSEAIVGLDISSLKKMTWLFVPKQKIRSILVSGLVKAKQADAIPLMEQLCRDNKTTLFDCGRCLDCLQELGVSVDSIDSFGQLSFTEIIAMADEQKFDNKKSSQLLDEVLLTSLNPLSENAAKWMIDSVNMPGLVSLPRLAKTLFSFVPEDSQVNFCEEMIQRWQQDKNSSKLDWIFLFIRQSKSDFLVQKLSEAIITLGKSKPNKVNNILISLFHIGTTNALHLINQVYEKPANASVRLTALGLLKQIAEIRCLELTQIRDELVPDYDIDDGKWYINSSDFDYCIILADDYTLRVIGETGRMTKTFPKPKKEVDTAQFEQAQADFKKLKSNLSDEVKRLRSYLKGHLAASTSWRYERWSKLNIEHPLVSILVKSVIWSKLNADGKFVESFRVDGKILINSTGKVIELDSENHVRVWHPCDDDEDTKHLWRNNILESGLLPIVDQLDLPIVYLTDKEKDSVLSYKYQGYVLNISEFRKLMNRLGFTPSGGDKGYESSFYYNLPESTIAFLLEVTSINTFKELNDTVIIYFAKIVDRDFNASILTIKDVHPNTLAMFYSMQKQIADASLGYHEDWGDSIV